MDCRHRHLLRSLRRHNLYNIGHLWLPRQKRDIVTLYSYFLHNCSAIDIKAAFLVSSGFFLASFLGPRFHLSFCNLIHRELWIQFCTLETHNNIMK